MVKKNNRNELRKTLDTWLPTVARYAGVILMVYAALIDRGKNPALIPAATGMLLLKTVYGSGDRD